MEVHYKKFWGYFFIGGGVINAALYFLNVMLRNNLWQLALVAAVLFLVGRQYLKKPIFSISDNKLVIYALVGPARKTHEFSSFDEFRIEKDKVYINDKKIGISKSVTDKRDWEEFLKYIKQES